MLQTKPPMDPNVSNAPNEWLVTELCWDASAQLYTEENNVSHSTERYGTETLFTLLHNPHWTYDSGFFFGSSLTLCLIIS